MSWIIEVYRAKPNPFGRDKSGNRPLAQQLLGEWVDLRNRGDDSVYWSTLYLCHQEYGVGCTPKSTSAPYWNGISGKVLLPGQILRVHTGRSGDAHLMHPDDMTGVNAHAFAESGSFVLNNDCGDKISVWWKNNGEWQREDVASYDPHPPEGKILIRVGDKLVPTR